MSRRVALIVGVEKYTDQQIRSLECVDKDCIELYGFLRHAAGFEVEPPLLSPTSADVLDKAQCLAQGLVAGDLFLFYFAGHGVEFDGQHLLLCPKARMSRLRDKQEVVPVSLLKQETTGPADRVFVLDACRSDPEKSRRGTDTGLKGERSLRDVVCSGVQAEEGSLAILCACSEGHVAAEVSAAGHGLFTKSLLDEMQEGLNQGRRVELGTPLQQALAKRMSDLASRAGLPGNQSPWVQLSGGRVPVLIEGRDVNVPPIARPKTTVQVIEPARLHLTSQPSDASVDINGKPAGTTPVVLKLKNGTYTVKVSKDGYHDWERKIGFDAEGDAELTATLLAKPKERHAGQIMTLASVGMKLAWIPPGEFLMGSPKNEEGRGDDETQHRVRLTKGFWLGTTAVTRGQFAIFVNASGYKTEAEKEGWSYAWTGGKWDQVKGASWRKPGFDQDDNHPVVCVSWNDAQACAQWLGQKEGRPCRLPTEAQWEYACRAGTTTAYHTGDGEDALKEAGWYYANSDSKTHPVGQKKPNTWGLYDMHGNVWEWCADWFDKYPEGETTDPTGPASGSWRVLRGGSWSSYPHYCRAACRLNLSPVLRILSLGCRLALDFH